MSAPLSAEREREIRRIASAVDGGTWEQFGPRAHYALLDTIAALDHARAELAAASQPCAECGAPSPRYQNRPA